MCLGGGGSAPQMPKPEIPRPQNTNVPVAEASALERKRRALAKGQSSTVATTALGDRNAVATRKVSALGEAGGS